PPPTPDVPEKSSRLSQRPARLVVEVPEWGGRESADPESRTELEVGYVLQASDKRLERSERAHLSNF
ncbi:MAG TPA: hypothetical protein VMS17_12220, partial [Gemmataceae bacterium]|nr:hypothetical protein [Gemmataceae bacterium]